MQPKSSNGAFASKHMAALSYIEGSFFHRLSIPLVSGLQPKPTIKTKTLLDCLRLTEQCRK